MSFVYTDKLARSLDDLRKENQLCDVVITVGGRDFNLHKNVLAARSSYFLAMFTSGFREASESKVNIDGKPAIFEVILDFVYTGKMKISGETARELLETACYMQLIEASQHIAKFIEFEYRQSSDTIPMEDVYKISELASCHTHLKFLVSASKKHLCTFYKKLKSSDAFLQHASVDFLKKFLTRSDLSRKGEEEEVLELVVKWLKQDFENRREFATNLLRRVRLGLLSVESRTKLLDAEILQIPECKKVVDFVTRHQQSGVSTRILSLLYPLQFSTRGTITAPIAVVGRDLQTTWSSSFHYFDVKAKLWKQMPTMASLSWVPALIAIGNKLYAVGGKQKSVSFKSFGLAEVSDSSDDGFWSISTIYRKDFMQYDAERNRWGRCAPMNHARVPARLVYVNKCIYAIGAMFRSYAKEAKFVECFDMSATEKKWKDIAPLPASNRFSCTSAVACQGSLLLYGVSVTGDVNNLAYTGEILVYNPSKDEWQKKFTEPIEMRAWRFRPILFVHRDQCYRLLFQEHSDREGRGLGLPQTVVVHQLKLRSSRGNAVSSVSLGEEINQDYIPPHMLAGFRIGEEVFGNVDGTVNRAVHKIGLKIKQDQDISFGNWDRIRDLDWTECSNPVAFTWDLKN